MFNLPENRVTVKEGNQFVVRFQADSTLLESIQTQKLFNYNEEFFEKLPEKFEFPLEVSIIGTQDSSAIDPTQWQILSLGNNPTFFQLWRKGEIPGETLEEGLVNFSLKKMMLKGELPSNLAKPLQSTLTKLLGKLGKKDVNLEEVLEIASNIPPEIQPKNPTETILGYLKEYEVPYLTKDSTYTYSVILDNQNYEITLETSEKAAIIIIYVRRELPNSSGILGKINAVNLTLSHGNFEYDPKEHTLIFRTHIALPSGANAHKIIYENQKDAALSLHSFYLSILQSSAHEN